MKKRSAARNRIEYLAVRLTLGLLRRLPMGAAQWAGWRLIAALAGRSRKLRNTLHRNLEIAFPQMQAEDRDRIAEGVYRELGRSLAVFARFPDLDRSNIHRLIRYEGFEHYEKAKREGRGVLFATAHLGNWELSAYAHALMAEPMHVVVRPLDNPLLDRFVEQRRTGSGNRVIGKREFARSILRALSANEAVGILVDQNSLAGDGVFVDLFGVPASTSPVFAKLAARSGAAVIPGVAVWQDSAQQYVLHFDPPVTITGNLVADSQAIQTAVEALIRRYPEQWLWLHRRWKTRPPGQPELY